MKKILVTLAALILFTAAACTPRPSPDDAEPTAEQSAEVSESPPIETETPTIINEGTQAIQYEEISYSKTFELNENLKLQATAHFPQTGVEGIDAYYDAAMDDFIQNATRTAETYGDDAYAGQYMISVDYEVLRNDGYIFSVHRTVSDYFGGAHPNHVDICETFSVNEGRRLSLDDIFTVTREEYQPRLLEFFDNYIENGDESMYMIGYGAKEFIREYFPYERFCMSEKEGEFLLFYFSPYEIAPYAAGTIIIPVPREVVSDIIVVYE